MGVVTYKGPSDKADPSNRFRVPVEDGDDVVLRLGVPTDVPADVVDVLKGAEGHEFDFGGKRGKPDVQAEARELGVEFTDRTTVAELEELIAAKRAEAEAAPATGEGS